MKMLALKKSDPEIYNAIIEEIKREREKIVLIASENYASTAVLEAQGSVFTNNMRRAIQANAITEAVSMLMQLNH